MSQHRHHHEDDPEEPIVPDFVGFEKGEKIWVHTPDRGARPAVYVGEGDNSTFFGGPPLAYVVMEDSGESGEVQLDTITARE